jgi:PAS domain S-box-containing protein
MTDDQGGESACMAEVFEEQSESPGDQTLAQLVRDLADAVIIADPEGTIVFWNDAATKLFGWTALEAAGKTLQLIVPERLWSRHSTGYARVMETGHTEYGDRLLQVPAVHRDGHTFSIAFTVSLLHAGGTQRPSGIAAVLRDDTANFETRRALRAATSPS